MLTERIIRDAKPGPKPHIIWDGTVTGLGCKVFPSGAKSFVLSYRVGGRKRMATLARSSEITLREARERAGAELVRIRSGETDPLKRRREAREAPTVADFIGQFFEIEAPARIARGRMKAGTVEVYRYQAEKHILPAIGKRRVADIARHDIERMVAEAPRPVAEPRAGTGEPAVQSGGNVGATAARHQSHAPRRARPRGSSRPRVDAG